jgi:bacterioferritin (cytochrome b1)
MNWPPQGSKANTWLKSLRNSFDETILKDEDGHINKIESQLYQIQQMGIQNYLVDQVDVK